VTIVILSVIVMMESITVIKTAAGPMATVMMPRTVLAEAHNNGVRME